MSCKPMTVHDLEKALFAAFPAMDAESWDSPGLAVGDPEAHVGRVAFNLDMSCEAVVAAHEAGCNVLVTHHPAFIKGGPARLSPQADAVASGPGRMFYEAARRNVACIAMHTNADRSKLCRDRYAQLLGWPCTGSFEQLDDSTRASEGPGFGAVFDFETPLPLIDAAKRCEETFGGMPRVWGDAGRQVKRLALLNGSWGDAGVYDICVAHGIDCIAVGETRYHFCLDASPHLSVIDLGHDRSELPIVGALRDVVIDAGVDAGDVCELGCSAGNWWTI